MYKSREVFRVEDAHVLKDTGKALRVEAPGFDQPEWIPHSQIHDDSEVYDDDENADGTLVVSMWFAIERGWA
jgi:hypothetical protein